MKDIGQLKVASRRFVGGARMMKVKIGQWLTEDSQEVNALVNEN